MPGVGGMGTLLSGYGRLMNFKNEPAILPLMCHGVSPYMKHLSLCGEIISLSIKENRRSRGACDYCGDVQGENMEIEYLSNILLCE